MVLLEFNSLSLVKAKLFQDKQCSPDSNKHMEPRWSEELVYRWLPSRWVTLRLHLQEMSPCSKP